MIFEFISLFLQTVVYEFQLGILPVSFACQPSLLLQYDDTSHKQEVQKVVYLFASRMPHGWNSETTLNFEIEVFIQSILENEKQHQKHIKDNSGQK